MFVVPMEIYDRVEDDKGMLWSFSNPRTCPYWTQLDTEPIKLKYGNTTL
jgi:hypothetical protein